MKRAKGITFGVLYWLSIALMAWLLSDHNKRQWQWMVSDMRDTFTKATTSESPTTCNSENRNNESSQ